MDGTGYPVQWQTSLLHKAASPSGCTAARKRELLGKDTEVLGRILQVFGMQLLAKKVAVWLCTPYMFWATLLIVGQFTKLPSSESEQEL